MSKQQQRKKVLVNYKAVNRGMARDGAKFTDEMQRIPESEWAKNVLLYDGPLKPISAWRSKKFFAQVVREPNGATRISVNRVMLNSDYDFVDGITWDDLFRIKNEIGFSSKDCVEIYPARTDLVNVANIRHLFVLDEPHPYNWAAQKRKKP